MAGIPQNFQAISNVLPTYQFIDIVAGTGIITFYAGNTVDLKLLSNSTFYSDNVSTSATVAVVNTNYSLGHDLDFDVLINRPMVIQGTVVVNVPLYTYNASYNTTAYVVVTVRKWDGSTETDLISNTSSATSGTNGYFMKAIDVAIPKTIFKIGEYLRLNIAAYTKATQSCNVTFAVGNDPMNRSSGWDSTGAVPSRLVFQCPVRLNL